MSEGRVGERGNTFLVMRRKREGRERLTDACLANESTRSANQSILFPLCGGVEWSERK